MRVRRYVDEQEKRSGREKIWDRSRHGSITYDSLDLRWFRISAAEVQDSVAGVNGVADSPVKSAQQPFHKKRASGMDLFRISNF